MDSLHPDDALLAENQILRMADGEFSCQLCWKNYIDIEEHLKNRKHIQRKENLAYEVNPMAFVPHPHREVTTIRAGWPECAICSKRMNEGHWTSAGHVWKLQVEIARRSRNVSSPGACLSPSSPPPVDINVVAGASAAASHSPELLPQPPPPPDRFVSLSGSGRLGGDVSVRTVLPNVDPAAMVLESVCEEFHFVVWRTLEDKLGLRLAVHGRSLKVDAISSKSILETNERCRLCCVVEVSRQQLMAQDELVRVNVETELAQMLKQLNDPRISCYHLRVRRVSASA